MISSRKREKVYLRGFVGQKKFETNKISFLTCDIEDGFCRAETKVPLHYLFDENEKKDFKIRLWWWSCGQRPCPLFTQFELESKSFSLLCETTQVNDST